MSDYRPPYRDGAVMGTLVFLLYVITLAPSTSWWDASEYIATAHILGIPHPPGNPLFVAVAKVWSMMLAPLGLSVAVRVNLFAAATTAMATFFFFLVAHRILTAVLEEKWMATVGAAAGALLGATTYTVWNQANVNEKVYTVSVLAIALVSWLVVYWYDRQEETSGTRALLLATYVMVLGSTNHLMSLLALPAFGLFVLMVRPMVFFRTSFLVRVIPLAIIGLSFNFFLPIRAEQRPVINEGDPVCESLVEATPTIFTKGRVRTCEALASSLTREQYGKAPLTDRQSPFGHQMFNYFQWFDWQWARGWDLSEQPLGARLPATMLFLALGFMGFMVLWRADRNLFVYVTALAATVTVGLVFYMNFKYGYSLRPDIQDIRLHEVRERDYFFVAGFMLWGVMAGVGLAGFWDALGQQLGSAKKALPVMAVAFVPLFFNWTWADRSGDYAARDWAYNMLMSVEPYGVLFTNGDNDTFPLWYAQEVEGVRKDVTVIVVQYLYTSWYIKQLRDLTLPENQRSFDPELAMGIYDPEMPAPTRPITVLSDENMDAANFIELQEPLNVGIGPLAVQYPAGMLLDRSQILALRVIGDSIDERPIYFASTGGLIDDLGLGDWGVRHGLTTKLVMRDLRDPETSAAFTQNSPEFGTANVPPEWWDVDRNLRLATEVYSYRGLRERYIWQDKSTVNIPLHFYAMFSLLADAARNEGYPEEVVAGLEDDARAFGITRLGGLAYLGDGDLLEGL